jgi:hypothetical protein
MKRTINEKLIAYHQQSENELFQNKDDETYKARCLFLCPLCWPFMCCGCCDDDNDPRNQAFIARGQEFEERTKHLRDYD